MKTRLFYAAAALVVISAPAFAGDVSNTHCRMGQCEWMETMAREVTEKTERYEVIKATVRMGYSQHPEGFSARNSNPEITDWDAPVDVTVVCSKSVPALAAGGAFQAVPVLSTASGFASMIGTYGILCHPGILMEDPAATFKSLGYDNVQSEEIESLDLVKARASGAASSAGDYAVFEATFMNLPEDDRKAFQRFARTFGYKGAIDGVYGKGTEAALPDLIDYFQAEMGGAPFDIQNPSDVEFFVKMIGTF